MTTLVVGASGATGRLLVDQLLQRGGRVRAIVREPDRLPDNLKYRDGLSLIGASLLELGEAELAGHTQGCDAVASCLGHNLTLKGIYGRPRRLVTEATRRLCAAIQANAPKAPVKFVLMNTTGNRDLHEPVSFGERLAVGLLRRLLPPHADNEQAAAFLRTEIGQAHRAVAWAAVRPDTLVDGEAVTPYDVHPSPTRSPIFDAGTTSRINVAHFMAELITDQTTWNRWKGQMPVIYNRASSRGGRRGH